MQHPLAHLPEPPGGGRVEGVRHGVGWNAVGRQRFGFTLGKSPCKPGAEVAPGTNTFTRMERGAGSWTPAPGEVADRRQTSNETLARTMDRLGRTPDGVPTGGALIPDQPSRGA